LGHGLGSQSGNRQTQTAKHSQAEETGGRSLVGLVQHHDANRRRTLLERARHLVDHRLAGEDVPLDRKACADVVAKFMEAENK